MCLCVCVCIFRKQRRVLSVVAGGQSFDVAVTGNTLWLFEPNRRSHPMASDLYKELSLHLSIYLSIYMYLQSSTMCAHRHTHTHTLTEICSIPLLLNWRPSSWSGWEHCADRHKITNLTDASGLFVDGLCSVVMFILLSNFIVLSSLFLSLQHSLFSPSCSLCPSSCSPLLCQFSWSSFTSMIAFDF